jgi:copper homeostasis protein (lipoprotein)
MFVVAGCQAAPPDMHDSANSLDWAGVYRGTTPCADCEGIETTLRLSADGSFELSMQYLGRSTQASSIKGSFEWEQNGGVIALITDAGPHLYRVEENRVRQLDTRGNAIRGPLADKYVLFKARI